LVKGTIQNTPTHDRKRDEHLSKDGKWRSFPRVPHLLQYVSNGNYYGRIKLNGKLIRESLETSVWTTAKLKLADFLKDRLEARNKVTPPLFSEAVDLFKQSLEVDTRIKPQSKKYRLWCLQRIKKSWLGLWELRLDEITPAAVQDRDAAKTLVKTLVKWFGRLQIIWADGGYLGALVRRVKQLRPYGKLKLEIVRRSHQVKGFAVLPKRWIAERTFGWFFKSRRLCRDYEVRLDHSEAMIRIGMIRIMVRRLAKPI
jgi:transposase